MLLVEVSTRQDSYVWTPSDVFGLLQLIVGVLGLAFAGYQLWRTAEATERSTRILTRRLLTNDLLVVVPDLDKLEDAVDAAANGNHREQASDALVAYTRRVRQVVGHLKSDDDLKDEAAVKALTQAAKAAASAKGDLYTRPDDSVHEIIAAARRKILTASTEVGELVARLQKAPEVKR